MYHGTDAKEKELRNVIDNYVFEKIPLMAKHLVHVNGCLQNVCE